MKIHRPTFQTHVLLHRLRIVASLLLFAGLMPACGSGPNAANRRSDQLLPEFADNQIPSSPDNSIIQLSQPWTGRGLPTTSSSDVILHLFNYPFSLIQQELPDIAARGYAQILISPPQLSIAAKDWWGRYQPVDLRVIDGPLGNRTELQSLVDEAKSRYGIKIIVDLVFNHMANFGANQPLVFPPADIQEKYNVTPLFTAEDFHPFYCISNWNDLEHVRNGRICGGGGDTGLPDLRQDNAKVLETQANYLKTLIGMGVEGFRFDAVKHMEPWYFNKLMEAVPELRSKFSFGEVIADNSSFDRDLEPYLRETAMSYYDFPLQATLRSAFAPGGDMRTLLEPVKFKKALAWDRSVTFVINHDIPNNDGFRSMILDHQDEHLAYAFILGRSEGVPYVFTDQGKADGLRDDNWKYAFKRLDLTQMVYFHNAMHGSLMKFIHSDDCRLIFTRGNQGLVAINKCQDSWQGWLKADLIPGIYKEVMRDYTMEVQGDYINFQLPGRTAFMYLKPQ